MKKIKTILLIVVVLGIIGAITAYFMYNKKALDVQSASAIEVNAPELYKTFLTDSTTAKTKYAQKVVKVAGLVTSVSKNQQNQPIVLLKTDSDGASVNCTMEGAVDASCAAGSHVVVKGICGGIGQGDADMGILADVYILRGYISK